ncbi:MAG: thiosulfate/3-mercaptopyruvate sulfurtransferase [Candidatus Azotimanducaceae bacterium]
MKTNVENYRRQIMNPDTTNTEYVVTTDWLAIHLKDPKVRVLEVTGMLTAKLVNRAQSEVFDASHISGSLFFDVAAGKGVLSDQQSPLPWMSPTSSAFEATMAEYGIDNDTHVIIVARTPRPNIDSGTMWCTRAWWTMFHFGVHCSILEGGVEKWQAEQKPMDTETTSVSPGSFKVSTGFSGGAATKEDVLATITDADICLIDNLTPGSFDGSEKGYGPRNGHIKGAVNVPFRSLITAETSNFVDLETARLEFADTLKKPKIITYCGGAIAATVGAFTLLRLGHRSVSVYDASLMEWSADESLPMLDPQATI